MRLDSERIRATLQRSELTAELAIVTAPGIGRDGELYLGALDPKGVGAEGAQDQRTALSPVGLGVTTLLKGDILGAFHAQLRLVQAIAPRAIALLDTGSARVHPPAWLRARCESVLPPDPVDLYSLQAVAGAGGHQDAGKRLLTRGLARAGLIEFELPLEREEDLEVLSDLLRAVVRILLETGLPPPWQPFRIGRGLELAWEAPGRDGPPGARPARLRAVRRRGTATRLVAITELIPRLDRDPVLILPEREVERRALQARESFADFAALFDRCGHAVEWRFFIALGFAIEDRRHGREHLWFEVQELIGAEVRATLLSEPQEVCGLRVGASARHHLAKLSDWRIQMPDGTLEPTGFQEQVP